MELLPAENCPILPAYSKFRMKNLFSAKKIVLKIVAFKNKVLSLQSLIVLDDTRVAGYTNLVILSIYLKHKNTHNADIIRYCKTVKHLVGNAKSCGKNAPPFFSSYILCSRPCRSRVDSPFSFFLSLWGPIRGILRLSHENVRPFGSFYRYRSRGRIVW